MFATIAPENFASQELDASVGASGPHDFAVRHAVARRTTPSRPPHPAPNVRDDRDTPLLRERDGLQMLLIWRGRKAGYFLTLGWTGQIRLKLLGQLLFARMRFCGGGWDAYTWIPDDVRFVPRRSALVHSGKWVIFNRMSRVIGWLMSASASERPTRDRARSVTLLIPILFFVMAGPVPAIHVLLAVLPKDVDARDEPGHDDEVTVGKQGATGVESCHHPRRRVIQ